MTPLDRSMEAHQTEWRAANITVKELGYQNGVKRSWILPSDSWEEGLWQQIRSESENSLPAYLEKNQIQKHTGAHNLKSSWTLCANLYFPFRATADGRSIFASFLKRHVDSHIESLEGIELEYADEGQAASLAPSRRNKRQQGFQPDVPRPGIAGQRWQGSNPSREQVH